MMKKYEKYKESGIEWLGEIPEHWKAMKLRRLTSVKRGASPRPIDDMIYFDENGEYSWVRIKDVTASERYLEYTEEKLSELGSSKSVKLEPGNLFLSIAGSVGKPIINKIKCCIHDGFVYFPDLELNVEYLYYIFTTGELYNGLGKVGTQLNLNTETVGGITIPIPSSNEEIEKIVSFLDHQTAIIDDLIGQKEKLIALLKEKRQAIINEAVTKGLNPNAKMKDSGIEWLGEVPEEWKISKIKFVANIKGRIGYKGYTKDDLVLEGEGALTLGAKHIDKDNNINLSDPEYISWAKYDESPEIMVKMDDVIFTQGGSLGKICHINEDIGKATINPSMVILTPLQIFPRYLYYWLTSNKIQKEVELLQANTAVPMISQFQLSNFPVILPTEREQIDITQYIDSIKLQFNELIFANSTQITKLKDYRQSLISEAVTGKIDVRDWKPAN